GTRRQAARPACWLAVASDGTLCGNTGGQRGALDALQRVDGTTCPRQAACLPSHGAGWTGSGRRPDRTAGPAPARWLAADRGGAWRAGITRAELLAHQLRRPRPDRRR